AIVKQKIPVQGQTFRDEVQQVRGSNGWVVSPSRTGNGRAILANDMHLSLTAPVIWYAATLRYQDRLLTGMTVPGVPGITLGSNGHIAWGFTNTSGDFLDLMPLEIHPEQDNLYQTPDGWQEFTVKTEDIAIRGKQPEQVTIRSTIWGPVSPRPLLGKDVALRWTLLDPDATNCAILDIDQVRTVQDAIDLMHHFGAPPMNAMLADSAGHIGWTLCGKIPLRPSPLLSENAGPTAGSWEEYIPAGKVPCLVDPPEGFLITANNRTTGADYPFLIGSNYASGYRATQIASQLRQMQNVTEAEMFDLQLESICTFYQFYQQLSLTLLTPVALAQSPFLKEVHQEVKAWDGRAETQSRGIALLVAFREALATHILEAYLSPCLQKEETFLYGWNAMERPLRTILTVRDPAIFPFEETFANWEAFLLATLEECARKELKKIKGKELSQLTWGKVHRTRIAHPLGLANPLLGKLLNMPEKPLAGTPFSIRASAPGYGVTVRLVVSPSHEQEGKYHLPTGQSGRIFSRNYRDQYRYWLKGIGLAVAAHSRKHV
ncbi:MAG TPA: penicillin acylase family protein, partial [Ktedonobacteraceae bacterium]|nr:penicillin acylase family protein [Ktedonobacteraceae bacterium]